jgi:hypothetical protein
VRVSLPVTIVTAAVLCVACGGDGPGGGQRLSAADAEKLPKSGELWSLCPVPDVPQDFRERTSRAALRQARELIAEVRRRPDALVTLHYEDAHTGEPFTETKTVRALAREHLDNPGIKGVPCQRQVMTELQAAVDGRAAPHVQNERTYTLDDVVSGLDLEHHGAIYTSPDGCQVQGLYFQRDEVEGALDEPIRNNVVITSPRRRVGVQVFKPDRRCREGIARALARLDSS